MGSTTTIYAVVALAVALVCLLAGFLWGRSNLKSKLEQAIEQEHVALDAREFAMREQLDEAIAENARLRPLAEDLGRLQDRLRQEQSKYQQMKTDFETIRRGDAEEPATQHLAVPEPEPVLESADEAVQKLLKSLEATMTESGDQPQVVVESRLAIEEQPTVVIEPPPVVQEQLRAIPQQPIVPRVQSAVPPKQPTEPRVQPTVPPPQPAIRVDETRKKEPVTVQSTDLPVVDEWQEFARSLADLTKRTKK